MILGACYGRMALLCWLDQALNCRIPRLCKAHDRALTRCMERDFA